MAEEKKKYRRTRTRAEAEVNRRKGYRTPKLTEWGTISDLTRSLQGGTNDPGNSTASVT